VTISASEQESLRHHLQYGNISISAEPYSADGYQNLIALLCQNISTASETTLASSATTGVCVVTPASMSDIVAYAKLVVNVGDDAEIVTVQSLTASTFNARFQRAHAAGTVLAVWSGTARLRHLLHRADQAWAALQSPEVGSTAGLRSVDKGDIVWDTSAAVLRDRQRHYRAIVAELSSLVRVTARNSGAQTVSVY
jgi:hypothetical protein